MSELEDIDRMIQEQTRRAQGRRAKIIKPKVKPDVIDDEIMEVLKEDPKYRK